MDVATWMWTGFLVNSFILGYTIGYYRFSWIDLIIAILTIPIWPLVLFGMVSIAMINHRK